MAIDSDKVNQSITKGNAAIVLHTWEDRLWSIGSKGEPPEAVSASAVGEQDAGIGNGGDADGGGNVGADAPPGSGKDAVGNRPAGAEDGLVAGAEEKLPQKGGVPGSCLLF